MNSMKKNKVTDAQIIEMKMKSDSGVTISDICDEHGITRQTFYRRYRELEAGITEHKDKLQRMDESVTITIERLDQAAQDILNELESMLKTGKGYDMDKHDALDVIKTTVGLITNYRSALQKATFMIDNRQQSITINNVPPEVMDEIRLAIVNEVVNMFRGKLCDRCRRLEL